MVQAELTKGPGNVLIVDASKLVRQIIREELEKSGYTVFEADRSETAFEILSNESISLVTLSVELPGENGFEICRKIKTGEYKNPAAQTTILPVIFITSNDTMEGRTRGFNAGAANFILKPFRRGSVALAVDRLLKPELRLKGLTALVADDSKFSRQIIAHALSTQGVFVIQAENGTEAYKILEKDPASIDMVISDWVMPDMQGDALTRRIRTELRQRDLPIIILSGAQNISILDLYRSGATDYINKPFIREELVARLLVHLEARLLNKQLQDKLKELQVANEKLAEIAATDSLTGLPNRKFFFDRFAEAFGRKNRYGHMLSFILIDIDFFKKVNDTYGHQIGDWLLVEMGALIRACVRKIDTVARIGGEEFAVLASETDEKGAATIAEKIRRNVEKREFLKQKGIQIGPITTSIGVYTSKPGDGITMEEIYKRADERLYRSKQSGRNKLTWR